MFQRYPHALCPSLSICLYSMQIMFSFLCSVPGKILALLYFLAVQTAVFFCAYKPCLLFGVVLGARANSLDSCSLFPHALNVSYFFSQTHIVHSLSPKRLPWNGNSLSYMTVQLKCVCFALGILDRWSSGRCPTATGSELHCGIKASLWGMWS